MADTHALSLTLSRFQQRTLAIFGLVAVLASLPENDRRGLLLWDDPQAFVAELPQFEDNGLGGGLYFPSNRGLPRQVGLRGGGPGAPMQQAGTMPSSAGFPAVMPIETASATQSGLPVPASNTGAQTVASGGGPLAPGVGFAPSLIGASTVLPSQPPVSAVPAIPEPSSWILMILGVGLLGAALRHSRRSRELVTGIACLPGSCR